MSADRVLWGGACLCLLSAVSHSIAFILLFLVHYRLRNMATVVYWGDIWNNIDSYSWASFGMGLSIGLSVLGAAWYVSACPSLRFSPLRRVLHRLLTLFCCLSSLSYCSAGVSS